MSWHPHPLAGIGRIHANARQQSPRSAVGVVGFNHSARRGSAPPTVRTYACPAVRVDRDARRATTTSLPSLLAAVCLVLVGAGRRITPTAVAFAGRFQLLGYSRRDRRLATDRPTRMIMAVSGAAQCNNPGWLSVRLCD